MTVLVVAAEVMSRIVDWKDRSTCVLFGDGAGAAVLKRASSKDGRKFLGAYLGTDGSAADLLKIPAGGSRLPASHETVEQGLHYLKMSGNEVFKFAVKAMEEVVSELLRREGLKAKDIALLIPHQANLRIIDAVARRLGLSRKKVYINVDRYGNMSSASVAVGLDEVNRQGNLHPGDLAIMATFGSGFTWAACLIEW
jgi:3-oxoacyl-[acyl-carrier-protein] synthase-3